MRIGEALALRWSDLDLEKGTARIAATVVRTPGQGNVIQPATKTRAGIRTVNLPAWLTEALFRRWADRRETVLSTGGRDAVPVFPSLTGKLRDARNTQRQLRKVLDEAGFPWATAHTLRKTVATLLDDAGLSAREIANQLGHARPSLTQDVYLDRLRPSERVAAVL